jgi:hypothetical protein
MVKEWSYAAAQVRATMRSRLSEECINMVEACRPWIIVLAKEFYDDPGDSRRMKWSDDGPAKKFQESKKHGCVQFSP